MVSPNNGLPLIRAHERMDYKRCQKKWYWRWRRGLVPKAITFSALDLGTWIHDGLSHWYGPGTERAASLVTWVVRASNQALNTAQQAGVAEYVMEEGYKLQSLAQEMSRAYENHYAGDPDVHVIAAEIPLEFELPSAIHRLKPDLVYRDRDGYVWLMEHKTAGNISTEHLSIDDQARPYGVMAERALRRMGVLKRDDIFKGIMYNYLRKTLPDLREINAEGKALNKNGTVSARQPAAQFKRYPVKMTRVAKVIALQRAAAEAFEITGMTERLRDGRLHADGLTKTPHYSCPRFCQYFSMCSAEEQGTDIRDMERHLYRRENPYTYPESTEEPASW